MKYYGKGAEAAAKILAAFEAGAVPKALAQRFIHRLDNVPCNGWSANNQFLCALAGTFDARGFQQWKQVGRQVKKGEHAFHILIPLTKKIAEKDENGNNKERSILYGFGSAPVFAIEATEVYDAALWEKAGKIDENAENMLKTLPFAEVARAWNIKLTSYNGDNKAYLGFFAPGRQLIALGVENLSTWAHELNHAADYRNNTMSNEKAQDEIVAELGGATLLMAANLTADADIGGAWDYIKRYAGDKNEKALMMCQKLLKRVMANVDSIIKTAQEIEQKIAVLA